MLKAPFHQYLKSERNYSDHTIVAYLGDLQDLEVFLKENIGIELFQKEAARKVDHRMLRTWMSGLIEAGLSKKSVARKLASASAYFRFLRKTGNVEANPATRLSAPKADKKLPAFLKEAETARMFDEIEWGEGWEGLRNKCIVEVLYGCGLRRSELIGLQFNQIDFRAGTLKVFGKGRKERIVPFGTHVRDAMIAYTQAALQQGVNTQGYFFVNPKGELLNPRKVYDIVSKAIGSVSSISRKSPHVLRHTFATHLLNSGADLNAIKELLGHKSLAATQVYVHNSIAKLKSVYKKSHPKA